MMPNSSQLSAISRLFSPAVFREMAKDGCSPIFARIIGLTGVRGRCSPTATVSDLFDAAFSVLKKSGLRDEYIYRAAVTNKILLGRHSLNTASMLTEFRAGGSKADLVILNGTATVYEIKSERDSLSRLERQLFDYRKVFASVNVISSESHIGSVLEMVPEDVGVMCLSDRFTIKTIRESKILPNRICPVTLFESLRSSEAMAVLERLGVAVPSVPNTQRHALLREIYSEQVPAHVHQAMVAVLRVTRDLSSLNGFVSQVPESLRPGALAIKLKRSEHDRLLDAISTPLDSALNWM